MLPGTKMRDAKLLRLSFLGVLMVTVQLSPCHGLCSLVNETIARCHDLKDAKYIDNFDLITLKSTVSENRLHAGMFYNQSNLRHLELTHGELQFIEPGAFRSFHGLRSLDLSYNMIGNLEPTVFEGLTKLRSLSMRKNAMKQIPVAVIRLKNLKAFEMAGNPLDCNCRTLKMRDLLTDRGVYISKKTLCLSPANLKGKQLVEPHTEVICMFEDQDTEMQMDQAAAEGSGEVLTSDNIDDATSNDNNEEKHEMTDKIVVAAAEKSEAQEPTQLSNEADLTVPATESIVESTSTPSISDAPAKKTTRSEDEMFVSQENDESTKSFEEVETTTTTEKVALPTKITVEGSGEEENFPEGSSFEGSGTGVPPISWDISDDKTGNESASTSPGSDNGWFGLIWDTIAGTSAPPEDETTKELNLQEEEFISATERTSTRSSKSPNEGELIVPIIATQNGGPPRESGDDVEVNRALVESRSGQVKAEAEETAEAADTSPARQPQKGMGSYVVLAVLLCVLGALIGFAAYKGEFCKKKTKRNDVEGGTELKDMTKSLLDSGNGNQPKIASNGNLENVPLVCTSPPSDSKIRHESGTLPDGPQMRYSAVPDVVDPVKPPRKSFSAHEEPERNFVNGRSHQDLVNSSANGPEACVRTKSPTQPTVNGNNYHDSVSSVGTDSRGSPRTSPPESIPTNGSLGNFPGSAQPPLSPGTQRVKITLQDNPDSVPRTPILITRTKAGENLVKTP